MAAASYPADLRYTREHEWARVDGDVVRVGVTAFAVEQLGDVTLVDLPAVGARVESGARFGDIESVKTVSELFAPLSGEVVEVNGALDKNPELVNEDPYGKAWMIAIRPDSTAVVDGLMDAAAYEAYLATVE